jgi:hypothetical protein
MTRTLTAPDPAVFPADVRAFAAERGVTEYLGPLYELAKDCFEGAGVTVRQENDCEIPGLRWIVYEVPVGDWNLERVQTSYDRWTTEFHRACPGDARAAFVLGMR